MKKLYLILIIFSGLRFAGFTQNWHVYDATAMPDDDSTAFVVSNNEGEIPDQTLLLNPDMPGDYLLHFISGGEGSKFMWRHVFDSGDLTVLARLSGISDTLSNTVEFNFNHGGLQESLVIGNDGSWLFPYTNESGQLKMNPMGWHIYRIVMADSTLTWYLDEISEPVSSVQITNPSPLPSDNFFAWGDDNTEKTSGALIDWIIWDTSGAYAPGEGNPIPGNLLAGTESSDATLSNLVSNIGVFDPLFSPAVTNYSLIVPIGTESLTVLATPNDPDAMAEGDGLIATIPDTVIIRVTAEDGYTMDYTVIIDLEPEIIDLTLSELSIDIGTLTPAFNPEIYHYTLGVPDTVESIVVTAVANDSSAIVTGAGLFSDIPGEDTITVSKDTLFQYYIIDVRVLSSDASLISLTSDVGELEPDFNPGIMEYDLEVPVTTPSIFLVATPNDPAANVTGDGIITGFPVTVNITVTAQDNVTYQVYMVNVSIAPTSIADNKNRSLIIYPNPVAGRVTFETGADVSSISIYDSRGNLYQNININGFKTEVDMSHLPAGIYFVKAYAGKNIEVFKIVIE